MNKKETAQIVTVIQVAYPNSYKNYDESKMLALITLWNELLSAYDYQTVNVALKSWMVKDTSGFPPAPGQIIDEIAKMTLIEADMSESEAWNMIYKAISNSTYNASDEFERLPDVLKPVVGSSANLRSWALMDSEVVQSVVQSNCMRSFRNVQKRRIENAKMPESVRRLMKNTCQIEKIAPCTDLKSIVDK